MNLLCPACHTPLPDVEVAPSDMVVACPACAAEIDVSRAGTQAGRPRFVPEIDRTGSTIGAFHIEALIGGGGMGTVYRARGPGGAAAALKVLAPALGDDPAFVARFAREVETLARLDHPAIVRILANGTDAGIPWFAMELVDGPDLKTRLAGGGLAPPDIAAIFGRLFEALEHAHARAVVHRDLKPANVLLAADGAKLADFGIARLDPATRARSQAVTRLTESAVILGSLPYMSPEQKRGAAVDGRSDLFSAGVMLYEAATGTLPQGAFSLPSALDRRFGRAFDTLVMRLLHPDPARRLRSASEAGRALAGALAAGAQAKAFVSRAAAAAALTLVALFATLGGWTALRRGPSDGKAPLAVASPGSANARPAAGPPVAPEAGAPSAVPAPVPPAPGVPTNPSGGLEAGGQDGFPSLSARNDANLGDKTGDKIGDKIGDMKGRPSKGVNPRFRVNVKVAPVSSSPRSKAKTASQPVWLGSKFWPSPAQDGDGERQAEHSSDARRHPPAKPRVGDQPGAPLPKQARPLDRP